MESNFRTSCGGRAKCLGDAHHKGNLLSALALQLLHVLFIALKNFSWRGGILDIAVPGHTPEPGSEGGSNE